MQEWIGCDMHQEKVKVVYPSFRALDQGITVDEIIAREPIAVMFRQENGRFTRIQKGEVIMEYDSRVRLNTTHILYYGDIAAALEPIKNMHKAFYRTIEQYLMVN